MTLRLDGYIRVSRVGGREGEGYISPDEQRVAIEAYAGELDGRIVAWHDDQDFSGGNLDRPGFQAMLERLEANETDGIVVMKVDRFARSTADGLTIVKGIIERDQVFASCYERMDPRTPEGAFMLRSFFSNAELFLDQKRAEWRTSKARAIARGAHIGPAPIGYRRIPKGEPRSGCLVPDATYGPAMSDLFALAAQRDRGDSALARWMSERAPRRGGAAWNSSEIRRWLANRVYLGEVRYGDLLNEDAHDPLTDEETWEACQREPGEKRDATSPFLLTGLVRCAACRYTMSGQTYGGHKGQTPVYRCGRSNRGCPEPSVIVGAYLEEHLVVLVRKYQQGLRIAPGDVMGTEDIEVYDRAAAEVDAYVADTGARALMGEEAYREGLRVRVEERDALRPARDAALAALRARELAQVDVDDLDVPELRRLLVGMVRHAFIRRRPRGAAVEERVLVVWSDDQRVIDVPGPHRAGPFEPIRW